MLLGVYKYISFHNNLESPSHDYHLDAEGKKEQMCYVKPAEDLYTDSFLKSWVKV